MIHLLTYRNFGLLDPRIEDAYRRRHAAWRCECGRATPDDLVMCGTKERIADGADWLRRLVTDMEALAQAAELSPPRRKRAARAVVANAKMRRPASGKKSVRHTARAG
ncbi:hypothetical protein ACNHKD_12650 [Methylocystis sp. JAN1]|uniref:hypothetical protein n=1 Tax=Methylocystis sp. JAN1 TaxID=3397211 RepID=UPI003FA2A043